MMKKFTGYRLQVTGLIAAFVLMLVLLYPIPYTLYPTFAQTSNCGGGSTLRAQGLVTAPDLSAGSIFSTSGGCIIDPKAAFVPYKIPTYDDLKSLYFDQSKATKVTLSGDRTGGIDLTNDKLYHITGNLTLDNPSDITGTQTGVIFIDGNLTIAPIPSNRLIHGTANSGLVFVVGGNVNIHKDVTQVDAVIIAAGKIYTAVSFGVAPGPIICTSTSPVLASQLIINGSLIALSENNKIEFCRTLSDNRQPAEKINHQVKYLVILRHLMSDTYQKWSEIQ